MQQLLRRLRERPEQLRWMRAAVHGRTNMQQGLVRLCGGDDLVLGHVRRSESFLVQLRRMRPPLQT